MRQYRGKPKAYNPSTLDFLDVIHDGWVYGSLIINGDKPYIVGDVVESTEDYINFEFWVEVDPKTVGQETGLKDKNGVEIYEGDVIGGFDPYEGDVGVCSVKFSDGAFWSSTKPKILVDYIHDEFTLNNLEVEVIGNIHDNPELLNN